MFLKKSKRRQRVVGGFRRDRLLAGREFVCGREPGLVGAQVVVLIFLYILRVLGVENWRSDAVYGDKVPHF